MINVHALYPPHLSSISTKTKNSLVFGNLTWVYLNPFSALTVLVEW